MSTRAYAFLSSRRFLRAPRALLLRYVRRVERTPQPPLLPNHHLPPSLSVRIFHRPTLPTSRDLQTLPSREDESSDITYRGHARFCLHAGTRCRYIPVMQMLVWTSSAIPPRENAPSSSSSSLLRSSTLFSCSLARISPPLLPLRILLFFHLSFLHLLFSSSPPLFFLFFFFFAVAVVATPVSGSPQPAIAAALVLRVVIRMFVRELVSLSTSSSPPSFFCSFFSPPLPSRRHVAVLSWPLERLGAPPSRGWLRPSYLRRRCLFADSSPLL